MVGRNREKYLKQETVNHRDSRTINNDLVAVDMDLSAGQSMGDHRSNISLVEESEKYPLDTLIIVFICSLNPA